MASPEQERILAHPATKHGRILAGPGTGKSTTVLELAERLLAEGLNVRVITFTRAATAELTEKALSEGRPIPAPATVHSFALSILLRNRGSSGLPEPIRIPDDWETHDLIHADLARRLRAEGFEVDRRDVATLEREMAAGWESLDPGRVLYADINPALRNRYLGLWQEHRGVFAYSLFAEMPLYAKQLIQDLPNANINELNVLVVDEYQDLNKSEIELMRALASRGVLILAVGDDDQSIYSFRMAHPIGIQDFIPDFSVPPIHDYPLTVSFRCGRRILNMARALIESTPGRATRPSLTEGPANPEGHFKYLTFADQDEEREGIVRIVQHLADAHSVSASDIVILTRADFNSMWSRPMRDALQKAGIPAVDVEAALEPLSDRNVRKLLAIARLCSNPIDDLAWWAVLHGTRGVSDAFVAAVADEAAAANERFSERLMRIEGEPPGAATVRSLNAAKKAVVEIGALLQDVTAENVAASENGFADWLLESAERLAIGLPPEFADLAIAVGQVTPQAEGLNHFLNQLEPITKDNALRTEGVAIMTMQRSKGLTFRAAITIGVEEGVIPFPRAEDENEERRLLYVAMTRAREFLYLTMASQRTDMTAMSGGAIRRYRRRCKFFMPLGIDPVDGAGFVDAPDCC